MRALQHRVLATASGRLLRPMLAAAYTHWRRDWELGGLQSQMEERIKALEEELRRQRDQHGGDGYSKDASMPCQKKVLRPPWA